jgi:CRISPR/Cas system CSM-associated protein Csm3 (group 7 of RAMP superfamily)
MCYYRIVEITNLEPLKIGARGAQSTYAEPTAEYIPGSTLRGALIRKLIRLGLFNDNTKSDFLLGMDCYNAYPYVAEAFYLPHPFHLRVDKHKWREARALGEKEAPLSNLLKEKENGSEAKNHPEYRFMTVKQDGLQGKKVAKEYRLHHSTCKSQLLEPENLFRYEAISAGQKFRGILKYKAELEEQINTLLGEIRVFYLGGSKGSGYGKSELKAITDPLECYTEVKEKLGIRSSYAGDENKITITCLSDCLFRNELGQPINHLSEQYLYELTGKYPILEKQFIQTGQTEGYNNTWKARYPKETTVKAGSVLRYRFAEGLTAGERQQLSKLEEKLAGSRTQDGYGWLGVDLYYPEDLLLNEESDDKSDAGSKEKNDFRLEALLQEEPIKETFKILIGGLQEAKERWLKVLFNQLLGDAYDSDKDLIIALELNSSQLKNMEDLIDNWCELKAKNNPDNREGKTKIILERYYANDRDLFSLKKCDFKEIWNYLTGSHNEKLRAFASRTLSSQRGSLFYFDFHDKEQAARQFIADLVKTGLYIERMRRGQK